MRSKSVAQLSSIRLIFEQGTDELRARQLVAERISQITATLPTWASPPFMMPALSATSRIMKIGLTSDSSNLIDMSTIAYWKIRSRLLRVPGVAQVAIWGERLPQRHVQVDPAKLAHYDVPLQQVMDAPPTPWMPACCATPTGRWSAPAGSWRRRTAAQRPPRPADHRSGAAGEGAGAPARREDPAARGHGRRPRRSGPADR